jgi:hypothetical protein
LGNFNIVNHLILLLTSDNARIPRRLTMRLYSAKSRTHRHLSSRQRARRLPSGHAGIGARILMPAIAQLAPPSLMRATSRTDEGPAPVSAAASAIDGSPNIAITLGEFVAARKEDNRKTPASRKTSGRPRVFAALARPASLCLASCVKRVAGLPAHAAAAMARSTRATIASLEQPLLQPIPIATVA